MLFGLIVHAQKLTVEGMMSTNDMSASLYRKTDINGKPCALVKVQLATLGATFEGNVIAPVEYKTGEYWVYMTEGSRELHIKHPSFLPLEVHFADYDFKRGLQSLQTYKLVLVMPTGVQIVDDGFRYLQLSVEPATASVYIDDKPQQLTNGAANIMLMRGTYTYRVEALGYQTESGIVEIGDQKLQKKISLQSLQAQLTVTCPTTGVQIYINDQLRGKAPWSGQLFPGNYAVEARLAGHYSQRQTLSVQEKEQRTINLPALIAITGNLNVNYLPGDADVYIDGHKMGTSPDIFRNVVVGSHQVEIRKNGYLTAHQTVTINEGQTTILSGELNKTEASTKTVSTTNASKISGNVSVREIKNFSVVLGSHPKKYSVVVGNFGLRSNAESLNKRFSDAGYSSIVIKDEDYSMYRVIAVTSDDKNTVVGQREDLRNTYPDAWIMFNPN